MSPGAKSRKTAQDAHEHLGQERWVIDGIEQTPRGPVARVELPSGQTADVPLHDLPAGVREGDLLSVQEGPDGIKAEVLHAETRVARARAQARLEALNAQGAAPEGEEITL